MPDVPSPAITRPTMSIVEDVATPQIREPTSKTKKKAKNVHFVYIWVSDWTQRVNLDTDNFLLSVQISYKSCLTAVEIPRFESLC